MWEKCLERKEFGPSLLMISGLWHGHSTMSISSIGRLIKRWCWGRGLCGVVQCDRGLELRAINLAIFIVGLEKLEVRPLGTRVLVDEL